MEPISLQINALSALCRLLFGFRLAMTALAAPFALTAAGQGPTAWLSGGAVLVTVMGSYVLLRDWERFGPVLLRHPALLGLDMLFGALLLFAASPDSTLAYVCICTPLLAGLVYGPRGAAFYAVLQSLLVGAAYAAHATDDKKGAPDSSPLLVAGLCVIAAAAGASLRRLLLRFGVASQALTEARSRLAVADERARMAREMHDSVAKTLHGLALAADGLAHSAAAEHADLSTVRSKADLVAHAARQAAHESRALLRDLRADPPVDLETELLTRAEEFTARTGLPIHPVGRRPAERPSPVGSRPAGRDGWARDETPAHRSTPAPAGTHSAPAGTRLAPAGTSPAPPPATVPATVAHHLLAIASEAWENAHRHAAATAVETTLTYTATHLHLTVRDNGKGIPPHLEAPEGLEGLRHNGHYGLLGMAERAATLHAHLHIGRNTSSQDSHRPGTEVRLDLPLTKMEGARPCSTE